MQIEIRPIRLFVSSLFSTHHTELQKLWKISNRETYQQQAAAAASESELTSVYLIYETIKTILLVNNDDKIKMSESFRKWIGFGSYESSTQEESKYGNGNPNIVH